MKVNFLEYFVGGQRYQRRHDASESSQPEEVVPCKSRNNPRNFTFR